MHGNDLFDFMRQIDTGLSSEYERIRKRSLEDPGTAGDQGEENWGDLLREWLPANYHVRTKGRILAHDGRAGPQVDVLVLSPVYPRYLLNKKLYLAGGVVAAFECKNTLEALHITDAVKSCVAIQDLTPKREGSPYKELFGSIAFGLLAHSHSWKGEKSTPIENIRKRLSEDDLNLVHHPRQTLDFLCVADLACWTSSRIALVGPSIHTDWAAMADIYGTEGSATSAYMEHSKKAREFWPEDPRDFTPVGALLKSLLKRLSWEDISMRRLARYFELSNVAGNAHGLPRLWASSIYSEAVRPKVVAGQFSNGEEWDEWSMAFF
ncbi:MAG TPA: DUF6602 domain-containing protein [Rhizomicrobium sp.]|nr:DUF6602 domain-containing protein [Rhizomicrobium sp.]